MSKKEKEESGEQGLDPNGWMFTFSDMLNLLLTFFVMLLIMSSMDTQQILQSFGYLADDPSVLEIGNESILDANKFIPLQDEKMIIGGLGDKSISSQSEAYKEFLKLLEVIKEFNNVILRNTDKGLILEFGGNLNFNPNSAELTNEGRKVLGYLAPVLKRITFPFTIIGYSSKSKVNNAKYSSNLELSLLRAQNVKDYLITAYTLNDKKFTLAGMGYSKLKDARKPTSSANDRVEIFIVTNLKIKDAKIDGSI